MNKGLAKIHKRINITLPEETLLFLNKIAERGERSRLIREAVYFYAQEVGRSKLRKKLAEGAIRHAKRDILLAEEWFDLEKESWDENKK